jgi:hypothetical protein
LPRSNASLWPSAAPDCESAVVIERAKIMSAHASAGNGKDMVGEWSVKAWFSQ